MYNFKYGCPAFQRFSCRFPRCLCIVQGDRGTLIICFIHEAALILIVGIFQASLQKHNIGIQQIDLFF